MREPVDSSKGKKKAKQSQKRLAVTLVPVVTPDAEDRRRRAIDLILQVAARTASQSSKESTKT